MASAHSLYGDIIVSVDRGTTLMVILAMSLSAGLVALLTTGTYSSKDHVSGFLVPTAGLVHALSPRVGVINRVDVTEGELVAVGTPLFSVSSPRATSAGVDVDQVHVDRLMMEERSIDSQIRNEHALTAERRASTLERIEALERELGSIRSQRETAIRLVELAGRDVSRLETLQTAGHISVSLVDVRKAEVLRARESSQLLERQGGRVEGEIASLRSVLKQLPLELNLKLDNLRARSLSLARQLAEAQAQKSVVVRAQVAGKVAAVTAHVGMAVAPDRQVLSIIPAGEKLQAELLVPTRSVGFVKEGQEVRIRYDAFPYQKFGMHRGTVSSISRAVLNPEDHIGPVRLPVPAYRVIVQIESQSVMAYGNTFQLQSGLTLEADLIRDRRKIIEWVFDPLVAVSMRI